jgi:hypothetical protein
MNSSRSPKPPRTLSHRRTRRRRLQGRRRVCELLRFLRRFLAVGQWPDRDQTRSQRQRAGVLSGSLGGHLPPCRQRRRNLLIRLGSRFFASRENSHQHGNEYKKPYSWLVPPIRFLSRARKHPFQGAEGIGTISPAMDERTQVREFPSLGGAAAPHRTSPRAAAGRGEWLLRGLWETSPGAFAVIEVPAANIQ